MAENETPAAGPSTAEKVATGNGGGTATTPKSKVSTKKGSDLVVETAHKLENLKKDKAYKMVRDLIDQAEFTYFQLGGVLSTIHANGWFTDEGYENFKSFVQTEFGIEYRTAMHWISIYNGLVESGVAWDKVKHLGWSKLKELANILTPDSVEEWVKAAEKMTVLQLQEYIKPKQAGTLPAGEDGEPATPEVSSLSFKVHKDQREVIMSAIEKAKNEAKTEYPAVALEAVCMQFLNSGQPAAAVPAGLKDAMQGSTWEEVLEYFEELWPNVHLTVEV